MTFPGNKKGPLGGLGAPARACRGAVFSNSTIFSAPAGRRNGIDRDDQNGPARTRGQRLHLETVSEYSLTMPTTGRGRLLAAALKLFAEKGYSATSVADIQRASGLAPGSGALYKHFSSKRELLDAAVAYRIDSIVAAREQYDADEPPSVEQAVRTAGRLIWDNLKQGEDLLKVMLREPEELGDLDDKTWQVITDNAYQRFAEELAASNQSGRTNIPDPEAAAAVAIASLSHAATLQALTGRTPGNIDDDRYFEAWVNQTVSVLAQYRIR
jgi:AcrR family transcriptional regulator